jgi:outer membrane lipoprotein-sorting protein
MCRNPLFVVMAVLALTLPTPATPAEESEGGNGAFARMARRLLNGATDEVRSIRSTLTIETFVEGESVSMAQELSYELPDKIRNSIQTPLGKQVIVVNGKRGAAITLGGSEPASAQRVEYGLRSLGRQLLVLAGNAGDSRLQVSAAGTETVGSDECNVISVSFMGAESKLWIDPEGKALKQRYKGRHFFEGTPGLVEINYFDYGEMGGALVPRTRTVSFEHQHLATLTVDSLELNPDLNAGLFELPAGE